MKLSILFLSILIIIFSNVCLAGDKQLHVLVGSTVGSAVYNIKREQGAGQVESLHAAMLASLAVGLAKEAYDASLPGGKADLTDAAATTLGGLVVPLFISSF